MSKDEQREYFRNWCREHEDYIKKYHKNYYKQNSGLYVYLWKDIDTEEVKYIGSTTQIKRRYSNHKNGFNGINTSLSDVNCNLYYADLSSIDINRSDLYYIEKYLQENHENLLGNKVANKSCENISKSIYELETIADNLEFIKM